MSTANTDFARLTRLMNRYPSQSKLQMYRNLCFGAAGTSLLIVLVNFQTGEESLALSISQFGAATSLPIWTSLAGLFEYYVLIGPRSYPYYRKIVVKTYAPALFALGGVSVLASIGGILYQLQDFVLYAFIVSIVVSVVVAFQHHVGLAQAFFDDQNKKSEQPANDK